MPNEVQFPEFGTTVTNVFAVGGFELPTTGESETVNPMNVPRIAKIVINIGVGEGGTRLVNAEKVLELLTGEKPQRTYGRIQNRDLKVREGAPIGCKVTMRDQEKINQFLKGCYMGPARNNPCMEFRPVRKSILSVLAITLISLGKKYDPDIGIYGMDVNVVIERPGHRVSRRRRAKAKVGTGHRVTKTKLWHG